MTQQVECVGTKNALTVAEDQTERAVELSQGKVTLPESTTFFRWTGLELVPASGACPQG